MFEGVIGSAGVVMPALAGTYNAKLKGSVVKAFIHVNVAIGIGPVVEKDPDHTAETDSDESVSYTAREMVESPDIVVKEVFM